MTKNGNIVIKLFFKKLIIFWVHRLDILTEDSETFQCILHSLKNLLERAQSCRQGSIDEFGMLSQAVIQDKTKIRLIFQKCKHVFQILSDFQPDQQVNLRQRQKNMQAGLSDLKSWWSFKYHPRLGTKSKRILKKFSV